MDMEKYFLAIASHHKFSCFGIQAQVELALILQADGFVVKAEVQVPGYTRPTRAGNRNGRIDLFAKRDSIVLGIEIDSWSTPKSKSVEKLICFQELTHRVVLLNHDIGMLGKPVYFPSVVKACRRDIDVALHLDVYYPDNESDAQTAAYAALKNFRMPEQ